MGILQSRLQTGSSEFQANKSHMMGLVEKLRAELE